MPAWLPTPRECSIISADKLRFFGHRLAAEQLKATPRRRAALDVVGVARSNSIECIEVLMDIVRSKRYAAFDRINAAREVLNRGLGKGESAVNLYNVQNNLVQTNIQNNGNDANGKDQPDLPAPLENALTPEQWAARTREIAQGLIEVIDRRPEVGVEADLSGESPPPRVGEFIETLGKISATSNDNKRPIFTVARALPDTSE